MLACEAEGGRSISIVSVFSRAVELSWIAPTSDVSGSPIESISEYRIRYGTASEIYDEAVSTPGDQTRQTLDLSPGDYFLTITSLDNDGSESAPAEEVSFRVQ